MKIYNNYTNEEKVDYKLRVYIESLCTLLKLPPNILLVETAFNVINLVTKVHGNKRMKLKDTIIIICISRELYVDPIVFTGRLKIENKYIYSAYKLFASIPELKDYITPIDSITYIKRVFDTNSVCKNDHILEKTELLLEKCKKLGILSKHTDITQGVSCLYHTLVSNDYTVDLDAFSKLYSVSKSTILKTVKKISDAF
jgi:transcription initiation factor TFIIIB Brf1 subunit/transcription initiation factor TFIIB